MEQIQNLTVLDIIQMPQFESQLVRLMFNQPAHIQRRLRAFKTRTGLWSGERLAAEYRKILTQSSSEPSTVRLYITALAAEAAECVRQDLLREAQRAAKEAAAKKRSKKAKTDA